MKAKFTFLILLTFCYAATRAQYIYTFAGNGYGASTGSGGYTGDGGLAVNAELSSPTGVAYDGAGNIYIADKANNVIRKVNTVGVISTFAGTGVAGYSGDHGPASLAKFSQPYGVAADIAGNVYVSDLNNNVIRKINTSGIITTYAGNGTVGYSGDSGPATAAQLNSPLGIALDSLGNLFIADANNNAVRKVTPSGMITTIAGNGSLGYSGDGGLAVLAKLHYPSGVAVNPYDEVFIADYYNNVVRKIDLSGNISTFAGNGTIGNSGDGHAATSAQLHNPSAVAIFNFNNVYISDQGNDKIRLVDRSGMISTYAGTYTNGYLGDGGLAINAELSSPRGIAVNSLNQLFIADYDNNVIRIVRTFTAAGNTVKEGDNVNVYPNPSNGCFTVEMPAGNTASISVSDVLGRAVYTATTTGKKHEISLTGLPAGSYLLQVADGNNIYRSKIMLQ